MSDGILQVARKLILDKKFEDARILLRELGDNPIAQQWLKKLDEIDPPKQITISGKIRKLTVSQVVSDEKDEETSISSDIPDIGKWTFDSKVTEIDDTSRITLMLDAEKPIVAWLTTYTPVLVLRWENCDLEIYVHTVTSATENTSGVVPARIRFDKAQPLHMMLNPSSHGQALFFENPRPMLRQMLKSSRLVFSFTPFNAAPTETLFDLTGLSEGVKLAAKICGRI